MLNVKSRRYGNGNGNINLELYNHYLLSRLLK
nr:CPPV135 hypothetical protein [Cooks petrelpox virus]